MLVTVVVSTLPCHQMQSLLSSHSPSSLQWSAFTDNQYYDGDKRKFLLLYFVTLPLQSIFDKTCEKAIQKVWFLVLGIKRFGKNFRWVSAKVSARASRVRDIFLFKNRPQFTQPYIWDIFLFRNETPSWISVRRDTK